ncbi:MAG: trypsin-like serine protease, partial [Deltaproteobacteria bacterium]|nr:trypsin-like serine protease [Deltaproteobacteria bacterium]
MGCLVGLACMTSTACGGDGPLGESLGMANQAIINGTDEDPNDPRYSAMVTFRRNGNWLCTGTFITSHLILSAGHCFGGDGQKGSAPNEGFWCAPGWDTDQCAPHVGVGYARDGWLAGAATPGEYIAHDAIDIPPQAGQGQTYYLDYVWFAPRPGPD